MEFPLSELAVSIDALSVVITPSNQHWRHAVEHFLRANFGCFGWEQGGGWRGYECSARVGGVLVAWGGEQQRGTVLIDLPGSVCSGCDDWSTVREWVELMHGRITRCDVAGDDFEGVRVNVQWARDQYFSGGFSQRGTKPGARLIDDLGSGEGCTFYVGKRQNGKLARIYEKGRELGDALSRWCRFEVEFRSKDRVIPLEILERPAQFLAGAYPCASLFSTVRERIRTFKERAKLVLGQVVINARAHAGRAINAMLLASQGDIGEVVNLLRRSGLPKRLNAADMMRLCAAEGS